MAKPFDPYHLWLGIPPEEQPANHYRLLGIKLFESNPDVVENAVDQRMVHLRSFQLGQYADLSQKLLNEVATAKVCLLRPEKKAAYDQQLRQQLQSQAEAAESSRPEIDSQLARALELEARKGRSQTRQAPKPGRGLVLGVAGAAAALVVIVAVWAMATRKAPVRPTQQVAATPPAGKGLGIRDWGSGRKETASQPPITNPGSQISNLKSQIASPQSKIQNLKSEIANPQSRIPDSKSEIPSFRSQIPALAKPAMSAAEAAQAQRQWAEYLGLPVKETNLRRDAAAADSARPVRHGFHARGGCLGVGTGPEDAFFTVVS